MLKYASSFDATLVTLEHRYYGESLPFGSAPFTTETLRLLTVEQALADLALFIQEFAAGRPVVVFGCSYAGALSAWFRVWYPEIAIGAISSSGVVEPILDFYQFDQQVTASLQEVDPQCLLNLQQAYSLIESSLNVDPVGLLELFNASGFNNLDFLYYMADSAAETVQYGYQSTLCQYLSNQQDLVVAYAKFVNSFYSPVFLGYDVSSYSRANVAQPTPNANRAWWYQTCSQLAYFQTAPASQPLRSSLIDLQYFKQFCADVFGPNVWPDPSKIISKYGGNVPNGTNILFFQSSQDPWQWAGVQNSIGQNLGEFTVVCTNCGHCSDTRGCPSLPPLGPNSTQGGCNNMQHVNDARYLTADTLALWLSDLLAK